jgi:colicin import membrane protein
VSRESSLGTRIGTASLLSQSEIDALRAQIQACWNPPVGAENAQELIVRVRVQFRLDGTLSAEPTLVNRGSSPYFQVAAESALRAVRRCQPYTMPAAKYDIWRDVEVTFDPRDMFGG